MAIVAQFIYDYDTDIVQQNIKERFQTPSAEHPFGTCLLYTSTAETNQIVQDCTHDLLTDTNLTTMQNEGELVDHWEMLAPDHWRFVLKDNVTFHDGTILNVDDVEFTFQRAAEKSTTANYMAKISEFIKVDDLTFEVKLLAGDVDFNYTCLLYTSFALKERAETLLAIASLAVAVQEEYLAAREPGALRPLTMTAAARKTGLSLSTVSRTVNGKYAEFEGRVFPLRMLFTAGGKAGHSREAIVRRMRALLSTANGEPMSDARLAALLAAEGMPVSRRTVNKYRNAFLKIDN